MPGADSAQCVYTPRLPAKVVVNQDVVGLDANLDITANDPTAMCSAQYDVSVHLVHSSDSFFLAWDQTDTADNESVYAYEVKPGTYTTATDADCLADSADFEQTYSCAVEPASTVIKFAGHAKLTAVRGHGRAAKKITFTVSASRYGEYGPVAMPDTIQVQRYSAGAWHTIHTVRTVGKKAARWTYTQAARAKYRAVAAETATAFAGTSASMTK